MDDTNLRSTKFLLAILLVVIGAILVFMGRFTPDQFNALVTPVIGFYFAANVIGKASTAVGSYFSGKEDVLEKDGNSSAILPSTTSGV